MELLQLFVTASIPVLKVLLITALGSCLALDRVDVLGEVTRKNVNTVVFYVFNPTLVGSNLARTITYQSMVKLWFMPVNILIAFIIGSVLGWILLQLTRPPARLRGLVLGCCAAGLLLLGFEIEESASGCMMESRESRFVIFYLSFFCLEFLARDERKRQLECNHNVSFSGRCI